MKTIVTNLSESDQSIAAVELVVFKPSPIDGQGGFAKVDIPRGQRIIEYVGEKIDKQESQRRCEANNQYIFTLNDEYDLDGNVPWNPARFINHSCAPNCDAEAEADQIWVIASRNIKAGEEITFNYGFDLEDYKAFPCRCGAEHCVGFIVADEFFEHVRRQRALSSEID